MKKLSDKQQAIFEAGKEMNRAGVNMAQNAADRLQDNRTDTKPRYTDAPSMRKGGIVRKTGLIRAHKGERVVPSKDVKSLRSTRKIKGVRKLKRTKRGRE